MIPNQLLKANFPKPIVLHGKQFCIEITIIQGMFPLLYLILHC